MHDILKAAIESASRVTTNTMQPPITQSRTVFPTVNNADTDTTITVSQPKTTLRDPAPSNAAQLKVKGLDEKAVLVQVKRRMYAPYKTDHAESEKYGAGNVNKHLFKGQNNRVKQTISKFTAVYSYVKDNTVPWSTGVDMLNIEHYFEFSSELGNLIDAAEQAVKDLVIHWDDEVRQDLARLASTGHADPYDYPSAEEVERRFGIEVRYLPVPTSGDFRVNISDKDKQSLQRQLIDAERNATKHVIEAMLEPMQHAVSKLSIPIGEDGAIFKNSLIDNLVDVAERMNKVNITDDPTVSQRINDLRSLVGKYANNKDSLRVSQMERDIAAQSINQLMGQMQGLV